MRAILFGLGLALTTTSALASVEQALEPLRISPIRTGERTGTNRPEQSLLQIPRYEVTCEGTAVRPTYAEDLRIETTRFGSRKGDVVLNFNVDETGRTRDIRPSSTRPHRASDEIVIPSTPPTDQEQAALAAWRFSDGPPRDCSLTIRYAAKPLAEADRNDLLRYFAVTRTRGPVRDAVADRLAGPEANCGGERRGGRPPLTVSFPDYRIGQRPPPGGRAWTVVRWGVNADGRAVDVETLGSSGDRALDAETRRAVFETVVQSGTPLRGCVANFYRAGERLPAPDMPERADDPLQNCPDDVRTRFQTRRGSDLFPTAFRERGIEGWALVRFDLATWGQVGNVEVIDAQPAAAFGDSGLRMVQLGRAEPSHSAGVRCVVPIRYKMPTNPIDGEAMGIATSADNAAD
jgi:TonB family protein